jgi:hypothetical protein
MPLEEYEPLPGASLACIMQVIPLPVPLALSINICDSSYHTNSFDNGVDLAGESSYDSKHVYSSLAIGLR